MKGRVYVMSNRPIPGLVKVGYSTQDAIGRAAEVQHAGSSEAGVADYGTDLANVTAADGVDDGWPETAPVGSFPPNPPGLHDMSGNVWEWVADIYAADAYARHGARNPLYVQEGPSRLVPGGAWSHDAPLARCSKRHMHCRPSVRYDIIGFRLVREP